MRVRAEAARNISIAAAKTNNNLSEGSDKMLEYDEYKLRLSGLEKNITELRDAL